KCAAADVAVTEEQHLAEVRRARLCLADKLSLETPPAPRTTPPRPAAADHVGDVPSDLAQPRLGGTQPEMVVMNAGPEKQPEKLENRVRLTGWLNAAYRAARL